MPVAYDGHWADDKSRVGHRLTLFSSKLTIVQQERDKLYSFSQSHRICQAGAETKLLEKCQPGDSLELIGAELALEVQWGLDGRYFDTIGQLVHEFFDPALALDVDDLKS